MNKSKKEVKKISRRKFIANTATAAAGISIVPSNVVAGLGHTPPSDKLNIVGIGIGGRGFPNLKEMESQNIIGLCDVDWKYSKHVFDYFPKAKKFKDWRRMYDELGDSIDGVMIATPDHTHALPAAHAIIRGLHVYVQKPLTHTIYEARLLSKLAKKHGVATQMGNQGASEDDASKTIEWLYNAEIGEVRKVEAFTDRPIWPQGLNKPTQGEWVPDTLEWDLFVGPAKIRPYNEAYHPWSWRGWWNFGTGAFGDMGTHILHPVYEGLNLGHVMEMQGSSTLLLEDSAPTAQTVELTFPERDRPKGMKMKLPQFDLIWYDGGLKPSKPEGWPAGKKMNNGGGGVIYHGSKDTLITGSKGRDPWLLSGRIPKAPQFRRRIKRTHEMDWIRACKESPENREPTASNFEVAGPLTEMVIMGVLPIRLQRLRKKLKWDGEEMEFTNIDDNETIKIITKNDFIVEDGHPTFTRKWTGPINAKAFSIEMINHTYREPWSLPEMPKSR